ncbi:helix-turn-helix transcriptional regulator [Ectothiorhodospira variabilis]|uniref:helix-turn-helix transcriptional regulator n=1 Tax=Ectothiorhodospira variabilis TaxID=505694 RepID=UPI001EFBF729|nr:AlpA family transcriptional regulator [Ectothiorhodospira variabilis]MCG5494411.1 AlpA family transcriptional regulator [Ectothiorhodospira variabilis]MCG5503218.1 AlpA family transcriptional regulator [Ectothiorhodospira variabilis]MCG5506023.1 AlpA family transcriptional regulator [Ectothiorhodospira variabilis]
MTKERLLRRPEVEHRTGYKRSFIYKLMREGQFPQPVKLGSRAVAWRESDIDRWIQDRIRAA